MAPDRRTVRIGGREFSAAEGTVRDALIAAGIYVPAPCAGQGVCGRCRVRLAGNVPEPGIRERELLPAADLAAGWRLSCLSPVVDGLEILPPEGSAETKAVLSTLGTSVPLDPPAGRGPGDLGAVLDLGTTTLVLGLVSLHTGETQGVRVAPNPQRSWGEDVLRRGLFAADEAGRRLLREALGQELARLLGELGGETPGRIREVVAVGNTVMQHILLDLSPATLLRSPFQRAIEGPYRGRADLLPGLPSGASLYVFPTAGAYLGGDAVAAALSAGFEEPGDPLLLIDLGTNAELLLRTPTGFYGASAPAGPAFEGAGIRSGLLAGPGAVERVTLGAGVELEVYGGGAPRGLTASALVDLLAELRRVGILTPDGRLLSAPEVRDPRGWPFRSRLREGPGGREFILTEELAVSQEEIRALQLAQGAVVSAWRILLARAGLTARDLGGVLLAGTFGARLSPGAARRIGLLPEAPVRSIGNAAWDGARLALLNRDLRRRAEVLAREIRVIELAGEPSYQEIFLASLRLAP